MVVVEDAKTLQYRYELRAVRGGGLAPKTKISLVGVEPQNFWWANVDVLVYHFFYHSAGSLEGTMRLSVKMRSKDPLL